MAFNDFQANMDKLEICNLSPDSLNQGHEDHDHSWVCSQYEGEWEKRVNAGGCRNYLDTFWTNPQYRISVTQVDEDDDDNTGTIIVGLMQQERRRKGVDFLTIGYTVYKLPPEETGTLAMKFFKYNTSVAKSQFVNMREVCGRHKLPPGDYCIIPCTFEPNQEARYLLRVFSEQSQGNTG
jgi:calpain